MKKKAAGLMTGGLQFHSDLFHLRNFQHEDGRAAHIHFFRNAHVAHAHALGSVGSIDLLAGRAVLLDDFDSLLLFIIIGTDQKCGVAHHQKTAAGGKSGHTETVLCQSCGNTHAVIIIYDRKNKLHSYLPLS